MFSRIPFLVFLALVIAGILLSDSLRLPLPVDLFVPAAVMLATLSMAAGFSLKFRGTVFKFLLYSAFFLIGLTTARLSQARFNEHLIAGSLPHDLYRAEISSLPEKRNQRMRVEARVMALRYSGAWKEVRPFRCLISVRSGNEPFPKPGDEVLVKGRLRRPNAPQNPAEFDYARFLQRKGIAWTSFIDSLDYKLIESEGKTDLVFWSYALSDYVDKVFRKHIDDHDAYGLVKAMILGRRDDLRPEINEAFISSGTVHILSVSGLHMSIFFVVISRVFGFMKKWTRGRYFYLMIIAGMITFYSLMTGLPPSVLRAAVMCLVWLLADVFARRNELTNSLAISAFLILIFDPDAIFDVGFQLSYMAMVGIIMFAVPFQNALKFENSVARKLWELTAVSFAAQLLTFPLSTYYFHQFPVYFWLINPLVIDISAVLLPLSFFLPLIDFVFLPFVAGFIGWVIEIASLLTNWLVAIPTHLPGYLLQDLSIDLTGVLLLYGVIVLSYLLLVQRDVVMIRYILGICIAFALNSSVWMWLSFKAKILLIYSVPGHQVLALKSGGRLHILADSAFYTDPNAYHYHVKPYVTKYRLDTMRLADRWGSRQTLIEVRRSKNGQLVRFGEMLLYDGPLRDNVRINPDLHGITGERSRATEMPFEAATHRSLFFVNSRMSARKYSSWKETISGHGGRFWDLREHGAYQRVVEP